MKIRDAVLLVACAVAGAACASELEPESIDSELRAESVLDSLGQELTPSAAAIVRVNRAAESDLHLLARVQSRPNEIVEWYELGPGIVLVSGAGAPGDGVAAMPEPAQDENPAELWDRLSDGAPMPAALEQALARTPAERRQAAAEPPDGERAPAHDAAGDDDAAPLPAADEFFHLTSDWCDDEYYSAIVRGYDYAPLGGCPSGWYDRMICWDHITGTAWASESDAISHRSSACPYRGNVRMVIEADEGWISTGSFTILQNSYRWKIFHDDSCDVDPLDDCPWIKVTIDQASGDGYQYRFFVNDDESL